MKYKIIGFTGTQKGMTSKQEETLMKLLKLLRGEDFHHGDCIGADSIAATLAFSQDYFLVVHPPTDAKARAYWDEGDSCQILPMLPYLERNKAIVDASDILIAAPDTEHEVLRSGTWSTVRYARKKKKPVIIIFPNGKTESSTGRESK